MIVLIEPGAIGQSLQLWHRTVCRDVHATECCRDESRPQGQYSIFNIHESMDTGSMRSAVV